MIGDKISDHSSHTKRLQATRRWYLGRSTSMLLVTRSFCLTRQESKPEALTPHPWISSMPQNTAMLETAQLIVSNLLASTTIHFNARGRRNAPYRTKLDDCETVNVWEVDHDHPVGIRLPPAAGFECRAPRKYTVATSATIMQACT
jgi:hypothetical protein